MDEWKNLLEHALTLFCGALLGQCWWWLRKIQSSQNQINGRLEIIHDNVRQSLIDIAIRLSMIESKINERKIRENLDQNNFIIPTSTKRKPGRPPKKIEVKNP